MVARGGGRGKRRRCDRHGFASRSASRRMYESGRYVARQLEPVADEQIQPNGVDLTLAAVERQREPGRIGTDGKTVGERETVEPADGVYRLEPGAYIARYGETIAVPDEHVGFVYPRSSLMRNSCMLNTAVWDAGYEGRGEGLLRVGHTIELEAGARIAQFVLAEADHEGRYDGTYQGERIE
ncbi:deoxyuridine 5'-triphosphate nucleotidohydrolase [Halosegnis longus]|uniref:deoxyuridine 5'-triphosphate nucleotidohydrolase n=1 Tax=Halosegnis longus TaxID=2216012 RepID=UPI0009AD6972|nr:deoxyuridine 5'-triphosphate nucleotidohydrolase [Salella cibi]